MFSPKSPPSAGSPRRAITDLVRSGFPFSTTYVASSAPFRLPTFFAAWIVPAGMKRTSPGLSVTDGFPSTCTPRPFENIDDLFTRMRVPGGRHPRVEFDDRLDDLASWDAEIVPLEIDAFDPCPPCPRHVQNQTAHDDDRRHHHHSRRSHVNLFPA